MTDRELKELIADNFRAIRELRASQRETGEQIKELRASQREFSEQQKKTDEQLNRTEKLVRRNFLAIASLGRRFGEFGNGRGEEAENFFFRYFESSPRLGSIAFDEVKRNVNGPDGGEHDIVLINNSASALISVKYKLHGKDVDNLLEREAERFRRFLRKLGSAHSFYAGVASFIVNREVQDYAVGKGLWVVARSGRNSVVLNEPAFRPRRFD